MKRINPDDPLPTWWWVLVGVGGLIAVVVFCFDVTQGDGFKAVLYPMLYLGMLSPALLGREWHRSRDSRRRGAGNRVVERPVRTRPRRSAH